MSGPLKRLKVFRKVSESLSSITRWFRGLPLRQRTLEGLTFHFSRVLMQLLHDANPGSNTTAASNTQQRRSDWQPRRVKQARGSNMLRLVNVNSRPGDTLIEDPATGDWIIDGFSLQSRLDLSISRNRSDCAVRVEHEASFISVFGSGGIIGCASDKPRQSCLLWPAGSDTKSPKFTLVFLVPDFLERFSADLNERYVVTFTETCGETSVSLSASDAPPKFGKVIGFGWFFFFPF